MDLELVEHPLDLPALRVEGGEFLGRPVVGVKDRRDQPVALLLLAERSVLELVFDDPHALAGSLGALVFLALVDARQVGPVSQLLFARQQHVRHHPPEQLRPGLTGPLKALEAVNAPVGQAQHPLR